ncbi:hypothetical protein PAE9249_05431 [Paenibacillus sp. CECT 9249]|nr:hypothetical protein PAE9249_05431 [Paenibacillus sp. CECT 9249]
MVQMSLNHSAVMNAQATIQCLNELGNLALQLSLHHIANLMFIEHFTIDNGFKKCTTGNTKNIGDKGGQFQIGVLQDLVNPILLLRHILNEFPTITC